MATPAHRGGGLNAPPATGQREAQPLVSLGDIVSDPLDWTSVVEGGPPGSAKTALPPVEELLAGLAPDVAELAGEVSAAVAVEHDLPAVQLLPLALRDGALIEDPIDLGALFSNGLTG